MIDEDPRSLPLAAVVAEVASDLTLIGCLQLPL